VEAYAPSDATNIPSLVRTGLYTWKLQIKAGAVYDATTDIIRVVVASADDLMPGFYTINGQITQISY
jgi:hypothetical protein